MLLTTADAFASFTCHFPLLPGARRPWIYTPAGTLAHKVTAMSASMLWALKAATRPAAVTTMELEADRTGLDYQPPRFNDIYLFSTAPH